jgi:REP element-mobilizing transposase RayT
MRRLHEEGILDSIAWVVMPDHIHWLFQLGDSLSLSDAIKRLKARSAIAIHRLLGRQDQIWQRGFHDHAIRRDEDLKVVARYIVANPLRAGLVQKIGDYPLWDAKWL